MLATLVRGPDEGRAQRSALEHTRFLLATSMIAIGWFVVVLTTGVVGAATLVIGVGFPLLRKSGRLAQDAMSAEQRRIDAFREVSPGEAGIVGSSGASPLSGMVSSKPVGSSVRAFASVLALSVAGVFWSTLTIVAWAVPASLLTAPLLLELDLMPTASSDTGGWEVTIDSMPVAIAVALGGLALLLLVPATLRGMVRTHGRWFGGAQRATAPHVLRRTEQPERLSHPLVVGR